MILVIDKKIKIEWKGSGSIFSIKFLLTIIPYLYTNYILLTKKRKLKNTTKGIKTSQQVATESIKSSQQAIKLARLTVIKTYQGVKLAIKVTASSIKGIIAGTKALISTLIAGGWIVTIIIIACCLIVLLCNSVFEIFFSNEDVEKNNIIINDVVRELNNEVSIKISNIQ